MVARPNQRQYGDIQEGSMNGLTATSSALMSPAHTSRSSSSPAQTSRRFDGSGPSAWLEQKLDGAGRSRAPALPTNSLVGKVSDLKMVQTPEGLDKLYRLPKDAKGWNWCLQDPAKRGPPIKRNNSCMVGTYTKAEERFAQQTLRLIRPESMPTIGGQSMLGGLRGTAPEPFHGEARAFGDEGWDGRMRGGRLARHGWAGTYPVK
mmetsp:Transcript_119975/g.311419  ORF Transcript_119975/g.311419 Transcript_119975/m.311419 type:complete len:205 (-) Transcript_119975:67-681(-)